MEGTVDNSCHKSYIFLIKRPRARNSTAEILPSQVRASGVLAKNLTCSRRARPPVQPRSDPAGRPRSGATRSGRTAVRRCHRGASARSLPPCNRHCPIRVDVRQEGGGKRVGGRVGVWVSRSGSNIQGQKWREMLVFGFIRILLFFFFFGRLKDLSPRFRLVVVRAQV